MTDIALGWHGSLQWGRRQVDEWHFLVDIYAATLEVLEHHPRARAPYITDWRKWAFPDLRRPPKE